MPDNRPSKLTSYLEANTEKNDASIVDALAKLEDPSMRGKLKVTVASICQLTGLSRNTVRNRPWALERLKALKAQMKNAHLGQAVDASEGVSDGAILDGLRRRVKRLLEQNALLYEEILSLRLVLEDKDKVIATLKARTPAQVRTLPRRVETVKTDLNR